jgi:hypothetical protein
VGVGVGSVAAAVEERLTRSKIPRLVPICGHRRSLNQPLAQPPARPSVLWCPCRAPNGQANCQRLLRRIVASLMLRS